MKARNKKRLASPLCNSCTEWPQLQALHMDHHVSQCLALDGPNKFVTKINHCLRQTLNKNIVGHYIIFGQHP